MPPPAGLAVEPASTGAPSTCAVSTGLTLSRRPERDSGAQGSAVVQQRALEILNLVYYLSAVLVLVVLLIALARTG
jgi:hypothetical protein